jgi:hypothetical protein
VKLSGVNYICRGEQGDYLGDTCGRLCVYKKVVNDGQPDCYSFCTLHQIRVSYFDSCNCYRSMFEANPGLLASFVQNDQSQEVDKKIQKRKRKNVMFARLFGETDAQQIHYLQVRVIITILSLVLMFFFGSVGASIFALVMMLVWGWGATKALFGITTVGAIFSGNVVFGVVLFVFYLLLSYLFGILCAALGTGRYIYLLIKRAKAGK